MKNNFFSEIKNSLVSIVFYICAILLFIFLLFFVAPEFLSSKITNIDWSNKDQMSQVIKEEKSSVLLEIPILDVVAYDSKLEELANNPPPKAVEPKIDPKTGGPLPLPELKPNLWPAKTVYPNAGAILPFKRIVAYYGNLYSRQMGVLGEYDEPEMLAKLDAEVMRWNTADPNTPVLPALHYIAVVAQESAGKDGKYRARMPDEEIEKILKIAEKINAIVFLDIQVGLSDLQTEVPLLEKYLKLPNVHLGVDPEFSMKTGARPGKVVGTLDAVDINFTAEYMARIVKENNLTPKIWLCIAILRIWLPIRI